MSSKIAIIGSRGIPAKYGGFETFAEEVSKRLVIYGNEIYVSCEGGVSEKIPEYYGIKLFYFPLKPFYRVVYETIYDIYSLLKASTICDQIYVLGYGAGFFFFIPRLFGKKVIVNVDGIEWKRDKYNWIEKKILYLNEWFAVKYANLIIADALVIKKYIKNTHCKDAIFIPYGADEQKQEPWDAFCLNKFNIDNTQFKTLLPNNYYLIVARLEPENNIHIIVEGFLKSKRNKCLVVVGNFLSKHYQNYVNNTVNKYDGSSKVIFTGAIYDKKLLNMLRQNCLIYFHGHSAGGTNPSLLEAMIMGNIILAHDNEFNREVGDNSILFFKNIDELSEKINLLDNNNQQYNYLKNEAKDRIKTNYSWYIIANAYNSLFNPK